MRHGFAHWCQITGTTVFLQSVIDLDTQTTGCPAHVGFKNLTNVHTGRNAQRVQTEVNRCTVCEERHVFHRYNLGNNTFVPVTARHLVARLQLTLHRDKDFDHLHHARWQIVAATDFLDLVFKARVQSTFLCFVLFVQRFNDLCVAFVLQSQLPPLTAGQHGEQIFCDLRVRLDAFRAFHSNFADDQIAQTGVDVAIQDRQLVVTVTRQCFHFLAFDLQRTFVFFNAVAVEDTHFDNSTEVTWLHAQRCVANIRRLLAKDGAQKLFFWRHWAFALRRDLTDQNVARLHVRTDVNDARLVEVAQRFFTDVWNVARDFLWAKLRVTSGNFEFFDVHRSKDVVARDTLGDQDGVFVVVAVPRHEGDDYVLTERQFTHIGGRTIGNHFALHNAVTHFHQRTLVDAGVLVGPLELAQTIDVNASIAEFQIRSRADNDTLRVHLVDDTRAFRLDRRTGVDRHFAFDTCPDQRCLCAQQRNRLTLHVRAHQSAVRVVVFKERDQGRRDRDQLFRRNVDQVNGANRRHGVVAGLAGVHHLVDKLTVFVELRVRLSDGVAHLLGRGHVVHLIGDLTIDNLTIRGFDEAVFVDTCKGRQRVDQTNVWTFRRFNRTHTTVVGWVHVAHLKAGTFAGQTAWAKRRKTTFVCHFGQRVGLVHELGQLGRAKEFTNSRRSRFRVDQILRHDRVDFDRGHTLFDRAFHAQQTNTILVFHQLTNGAHTTVAKVVDVVDVALAVAQFNQRADAGDDVFFAQGALGVFRIQGQTHVHLHAAHRGEVITLRIEEQSVKQGRRRFNGRWLTRAHDAVDVHERGFAVHVLVRRHGVADVWTNVDVVDVQNRDLGDARIQQLFDGATDDVAVLVVFERQLVARFDVDRTGFFVDDVFRNEFAGNLIVWQQQLGHFARFDQLLDRARGDFLARFRNHLTGGRVNQIEGRTCTAHTLWEELGDPTFVLVQFVINGVVIRVTDTFLIQTQRIKQGGHRQFAATVDARIDDVFGVELKVQPGAAVRDDAAGEQQFTGRMRLTLVVVKEHAGGTVHLGNDHTLGAVHHESAVRCHQRHVAHEDVLFLDILDGFRACVFIDIKHDQTQGDFQRRAVGHVALHTFFDVILRLFQLVVDEFQNGVFVEVLNRENRLEHTFDAFAIQWHICIAGAKEKIVRGFLNLDQVRHLQDFTDFAEVLAQAFLAKKSLSHVR